MSATFHIRSGEDFNEAWMPTRGTFLATLEFLADEIDTELPALAQECRERARVGDPYIGIEGLDAESFRIVHRAVQQTIEKIKAEALPTLKDSVYDWVLNLRQLEVALYYDPRVPQHEVTGLGTIQINASSCWTVEGYIYDFVIETVVAYLQGELYTDKREIASELYRIASAQWQLGERHADFGSFDLERFLILLAPITSLWGHFGDSSPRTIACRPFLEAVGPSITELYELIIADQRIQDAVRNNE